MARTKLEYVDRTDLWLNHPWRTTRVITVPKGADTYTLPSYYALDKPVTDPLYATITVAIDKKFKVIELNYEFIDIDLQADKEFIILVRDEALG
jgi:hypothetical protein